MARQFPKVGQAMRSRFRLSEFREVHPLASAVHRQLGIPVSELPDTVSFAKHHRAAGWRMEGGR